MKTYAFLLFFLLFFSAYLFPQNIEASGFGGAGYLHGESGSGGYQYIQGGVMFKIGDNNLLGPFLNMVNVDVTFNDYNFTAQEIAPGLTLVGWGDNEDYEAYYWLSPSIKYFSDHGRGGPNSDAWQKDIGFYGVFGANATSKREGWFNSYKIMLSIQQPFWSEKTGLVENGNIVEKIDVKAANKAYIKSQLESAVKRFPLGLKARLEPKLVVGYLYDGGSLKSFWEFGAGVAIAFTKEGRYYEAFSLQYRARYDTPFTSDRLDVIELNLDFVNLWKLLE